MCTNLSSRYLVEPQRNPLPMTQIRFSYRALHRRLTGFYVSDICCRNRGCAATARPGPASGAASRRQAAMLGQARRGSWRGMLRK
jgi:hypothetical protein